VAGALGKRIAAPTIEVNTNNCLCLHPVPLVLTSKSRLPLFCGGKKSLSIDGWKARCSAGCGSFPEAKIEPGETAAECVVREVKEEIGIDIEVVAPLATIEHAYTHFTITLIAFICRYLRGEAQALQCSEVRWVEPAELSQFPFPAANQKLFPYLYAWLEARGHLL